MNAFLVGWGIFCIFLFGLNLVPWLVGGKRSNLVVAILALLAGLFDLWVAFKT